MNINTTLRYLHVTNKRVHILSALEDIEDLANPNLRNQNILVGSLC